MLERTQRIAAPALALIAILAVYSLVIRPLENRWVEQRIRTTLLETDHRLIRIESCVDAISDNLSQFRANETARDFLMFRRHGMRWPGHPGEPTPTEAAHDVVTDDPH